MGQWFMGRSDRVFDDPKTFRPERWLDGTDHFQAASGLDAEAILRPFSLGPRNCIGKLLALAEVRLVIAKLLWNFDLELAGPQESWVDDARFYVSVVPCCLRLVTGTMADWLTLDTGALGVTTAIRPTDASRSYRVMNLRNMIYSMIGSKESPIVFLRDRAFHGPRIFQ